MTTELYDVPDDFSDPDWKNVGRVHEWRNYVTDEVRAMWGTFTEAQKSAIARMCNGMAGREEWD